MRHKNYNINQLDGQINIINNFENYLNKEIISALVIIENLLINNKNVWLDAETIENLVYFANVYIKDSEGLYYINYISLEILYNQLENALKIKDYV